MTEANDQQSTVSQLHYVTMETITYSGALANLVKQRAVCRCGWISDEQYLGERVLDAVDDHLYDTDTYQYDLIGSEQPGV